LSHLVVLCNNYAVYGGHAHVDTQEQPTSDIAVFTPGPEVSEPTMYVHIVT
jgi:hypothetical protein